MNNMEKVHDGYPNLFSMLHMCANFHHNRTNNKVSSFFIRGYGPLNKLLLGAMSNLVHQFLLAIQMPQKAFDKILLSYSHSLHAVYS